MLGSQEGQTHSVEESWGVKCGFHGSTESGGESHQIQVCVVPGRSFKLGKTDQMLFTKYKSETGLLCFWLKYTLLLYYDTVTVSLGCGIYKRESMKPTVAGFMGRSRESPFRKGSLRLNSLEKTRAFAELNGLRAALWPAS